MKIELPEKPPEHIKEQWEGQFSLFSYIGFVVGVPAPMFIVTTLKENGLPNAALSAWGMMAGSGLEPKFILQVHNYTDSRRLIERNGEFVVNFPSITLTKQMRATVNRYDTDTDEVQASGLRAEPSKIVKAPRIAECFACLECRVDWLKDIEAGVKVSTLVQASIVHAAIDKSALGGGLIDSHRKRRFAFNVQEIVDPVNSATESGVFAELDLDHAVDLSGLW